VIKEIGPGDVVKLENGEGIIDRPLKKDGGQGHAKLWVLRGWIGHTGEMAGKTYDLGKGDKEIAHTEKVSKGYWFQDD
jgi:hypothetical protein